MKRRVILAVIAGAILALGGVRTAGPWLLSAGWGLESRALSIAAALSPDDAALSTTAPSQSECDLPQEQKSIRFAAIGDSGTGKTEQYEVGQQMEKCRQKTGFDFVLMLGDNIYGGKSQQDFEHKFELPYKPLLDAGVKFYASIGNHDDPNERVYKPFNMGGARYYSFKKGNATFLALDSNYMDRSQLSWLETQLKTAN